MGEGRRIKEEVVDSSSPKTLTRVRGGCPIDNP